MIAIAVLFALATLLTWGPLRRALPAESLLAAFGAGAVMVTLLAMGHAG